MEEESNFENGKHSKPTPSTRRVNIITTAAIYLGNFTMGWAMNSFAPLLVRIAQKYEVEMEDVSILLIIYMLSYMIGTLLTNIIFRFIKRQLVVAVALAVIAFSMYYVPYCPTLLVVYVVAGIFGIAAGIYDTSQVVWIIEMWQVRSGPFIQTQHFFLAAGSLVTGLTMAAFLAENDDTTELGFTTTQPDPSTLIPWIPFVIVGVLATLASIAQLLLYIFIPYYPPKRENPTDDQKSTIFGPQLKLIVLAVIFFAFFLSMEMSTTQFISSFAQFMENPLTEAEASLLFTVLVASSVVGKLLGIVTILKIPPQFIIFINFITILVGCIVLLLSNMSDWMIWVGTCLLGLGFSTVNPSFCGYIGRHIEFTNAVGSLMLVGGSIGGALYPLALGNLIDESPLVLVYVILFTLGTVTTVFAIILKFTSTGWNFLKCT